MARFYYQLFIDSPVGRRLTDYWRSCMSVERLAERYVKRMGGQYYYDDPAYFAGGVSFISFPDNRPTDPQMWREVGTQHADGSFDDARSEGYKGAVAEGDIVYFGPNVHKVVEWVDIPDKDFRPQDTFDHVYDKHPVERDGKWFVKCIRFEYHEPPGRSDKTLRVASRTVRRAIKAELKRMRLPVMRVEPLLNLLGAEWLQTDTADGKPVAAPQSTPSFFPFEEHYYIGCEYACKAEGLREISPQTYKTYTDKYERLMRRQQG